MENGVPKRASFTIAYAMTGAAVGAPAHSARLQAPWTARTTARMPNARAGPMPDDPCVDTMREQPTQTRARGPAIGGSTTRRLSARSRRSPALLPRAPPRGRRALADSQSKGDASPAAAANPPMIGSHQWVGTATFSAIAGALKEVVLAMQATTSARTWLDDDQPAVGRRRECADRQACESGDETVIEERAAVCLKALDSSRAARHVEVSPADGVCLNVIEVARERPVGEQLPRPAPGSEQQEGDGRKGGSDPRRPTRFVRWRRSRRTQTTMEAAADRARLVMLARPSCSPGLTGPTTVP